VVRLTNESARQSLACCSGILVEVLFLARFRLPAESAMMRLLRLSQSENLVS